MKLFVPIEKCKPTDDVNIIPDGRSLSTEPIECSASKSLLDSQTYSPCDELVIIEPPIPHIVRMSRQERKDNSNIMEKLDVIHKDQQEK